MTASATPGYVEPAGPQPAEPRSVGTIWAWAALAVALAGLIDDVRTTGATLEACARALKAAGAAHVDVLTFALVPKPKQLHI